MTSRGEVPFVIDGKALSSVKEATHGSGGAIGLETLLVIAGLAVVAVGVLGVLTYLYTARETIEDEIEEVTAERKAFLAFADRIERLPVQKQTAAMATPQSVQTFESSGPPVYDVARAFEQTVMGLPHYEETYGTDVVAQMAAELDPEIVAGLDQQGRLTPALKEGLSQKARDAAERRADLLDVLESEYERIDEAEENLQPLVQELRETDDQPLGAKSFDRLAADHEHLEDLRTDLDSLVETRQRTIRETMRQFRWDTEQLTLQEYLYSDLSVTYPVLATVTRLDRLIERAQRRVENALVSRS